MEGYTDGRRIPDLESSQQSFGSAMGLPYVRKRTTWEGFTMRASSKMEANAASQPPKPHFLKRETTKVVGFGAVMVLTLFSKREREDAVYTRLEPDWDVLCGHGP
jgi:hypothetical protein